MTEDNRRANLVVEVEKSTNSQRAAEACLALGLADDSVSRAYYAAYHMVQALLLTEGLQAKTHAGLHDQFYLHFIRTGRAPTHLAKLFAGLQKFREQADYTRAFHFSVEDAHEEVGHSRTICEALRQLLVDGGWLAHD